LMACRCYSTLRRRAFGVPFGPTHLAAYPLERKQSQAAQEQRTEHAQTDVQDFLQMLVLHRTTSGLSLRQPLTWLLEDTVLLGVLSLEIEAHAGPFHVGPQLSIDRIECAVEEHVLDAGVVVEVFEVAKLGHGATWVSMD